MTDPGQRLRTREAPSAAAARAVRPSSPSLAGKSAPAPVTGVAALLQLQEVAGNRAVGRLVSGHSDDPVAISRTVLQRRADAPLSLLPPVPPTPKLPSHDPSFVRMTGRVRSSAKSLKAHSPARHEVKKAQDAAQPPANDVASQAKAAQVDEMGTAKPGPFDKARFMAAVRAAIAKAAPKDMKEAEDFSASGKADATKAEVMSQVGQGKAQSAGDIKGKAAQPPDMSRGVAKPVTPMGSEAEVAQAGDPGTAAAMPKPAPPEQTNLAAPKAAVDGQMAAAGVTEEQLARSNEPTFQGALASKKAGEAHSAAAPAAFRSEEAPLLAGVRGGAAQAARGALTAMAGVKKRALGGVGADKSGAKAKDEAARQQVAAQIESIYAGTKADTEGILTNLDGKVDSAFEAGEREAKAAFEEYHATRVRKWKMDNYVIPIGGLARWVLDQLSSPSPELLRIFSEARAAYTRRMETVISNIADMIGTELGRARARIAQGKAQIKEFVGKQKGDLRRFAHEAETGIAGKFDELTSSVDDKQESMVDTLAEKYVTAKQDIDARVTALQDENKGLWDQATAAIGGVIETIVKLKDMLLGILSRAAGAVERIVADPIAFLGRLITGVQAGLKQFVGNIVGHLKKGLQGWLFGALSAGGIEVPEKFDLKGIFGMVTSILGLTWANFRDRLTKKVGPAITGRIEQGLDFVKAIATEGIGGAWKWVAGKLSELKDQVMGQIRTFVMEKVVMAGVTWLISLLNPASAFVKACKMIYDAIMWFVDNGQQVKEFVESILDSTEAILAGAYSTVANKIEGALAKVLPMAISFLASLLGLGGLSDKIKSIIEKIQKPVNDVIDRLIDRAAGWGKRLFSKMKNSRLGKKVRAGIAAGKRAYQRGKAYVKEKAAAAIAWVKGKVAAVGSVLGGNQAKSAAESVVSDAAGAIATSDPEAALRDRAGRAGEQYLEGKGSIDVAIVQRSTTVRAEVPAEVDGAETHRSRSARPTDPATVDHLIELIKQQMPFLLAAFEERPSASRSRLVKLRTDLEPIARRNLGNPKLSEKDRATSMKILREARDVSRHKYYVEFRNFVWTQLRKDPTFSAAVAESGGEARFGKGAKSALSVRCKVFDAKGNESVKMRPIDFEHITRVSDNPFKQHSQGGGQLPNLTPMLADLNRYFQEDLRRLGDLGMWNTDEIEQFIYVYNLHD